MQPRISDLNAGHHAMTAMLALQAAVDKSGLEPGLIDLVKLRASQINGCAFCIDMHFREAKSRGESDQRLYLLNAWRDAPGYTNRERAALAWTEAVTLIAETHAPDEVFTQAREQFSEPEMANLILAIVSINGWNRFSIGFRRTPAAAK